MLFWTLRNAQRVDADCVLRRHHRLTWCEESVGPTMIINFIHTVHQFLQIILVQKHKLEVYKNLK